MNFFKFAIDKLQSIMYNIVKIKIREDIKMMYTVKTNKGNRFEIVANSGNAVVDKAIVEGLAINYYIKDATEVVTEITKKA